MVGPSVFRFHGYLHQLCRLGGSCLSSHLDFYDHVMHSHTRICYTTHPNPLSQETHRHILTLTSRNRVGTGQPLSSSYPTREGSKVKGRSLPDRLGTEKTEEPTKAQGAREGSTFTVESPRLGLTVSFVLRLLYPSKLPLVLHFPRVESCPRKRCLVRSLPQGRTS